MGTEEAERVNFVIPRWDIWAGLNFRVPAGKSGGVATL
jgi:hypothetical protein